MICDGCQALYEDVAEVVRDRDVFAKVRRTDTGLLCKARGADTEAWYRATVTPEHDAIIVGLYTPDRWLSESIEADLMNSGDKLEELLEDELIDQGFEGRLKVEHFRDDAKQYVFCSKVPKPTDQRLDSEQTVEIVARVLLAYDACFSELGDMAAHDEPA